MKVSKMKPVRYIDTEETSACEVMWVVRALISKVYKGGGSQVNFFLPSLVLGHVLSPVRFLPRHSLFADCKLYIRTHLLALAFSNFWKNFSTICLVFLFSFLVMTFFSRKCLKEGRGDLDYCIIFVCLQMWFWKEPRKIWNVRGKNEKWEITLYKDNGLVFHLQKLSG